MRVDISMWTGLSVLLLCGVMTAGAQVPPAASVMQDERRLACFVDFAADARGSTTLGQALVATEREVDDLRAELEVLRRSQQALI